MCVAVGTGVEVEWGVRVGEGVYVGEGAGVGVYVGESVYVGYGVRVGYGVGVVVGPHAAEKATRIARRTTLFIPPTNLLCALYSSKGEVQTQAIGSILG